MTFSFSRQAQRGSSLLFVVIMLAVLAVVGLAVITQANAEADGSSAKRQFDRSISCADAARELLLSQFRLFGAAPTTLQLATTTTDGKSMRTGHFDTVAINSIQLASGATQGNLGMTDRANKTLAGSQIGGLSYSIHVVCASANNSRQAEVEFLARFGL